MKKIPTGKRNSRLTNMDTLKTDSVSLRKFGITMAVACLLIAGIVLLKAHYAPKPLLLLSFLFIACAFIEPTVLRFFYILWMRFAFMLGWINTRIILCVVFFVLVTPISFFQKLFGTDLLDIRMDKKQSYWRKKEEKPAGRNHYERLF